MPDPAPDRLTEAQILHHAGRAIGKINRRGRRGIHTVTTDEIEAMAIFCAVNGVPEIVPDLDGDRSPYSPIQRSET